MPASQELSLHRNSGFALVALAVAGPLCLSLSGPEGLVPYVVLWVAALPILLRPLRAALWRELPGALYIFLTAARADRLDDLIGNEQRASLALVLLSFLYLVLHRRETLLALRSRFAVWLGIFFVQQIANAYLLRSPELVPVWQGRISVFAALVAGMVLTRRPDGRQLFPMLLILGVLVSVPMMGFELVHPALQHGRAGGMFGEPNEVGSAISFAVAAVLALRSRGEVSKPFAWCLLGGCALGILACASRSAFVTVLVVLAVNACGRAAQRIGRVPFATTALGLGLVLVLLPPLGHALATTVGKLDSLGLENTERLGQVVLAFSGSPDALEDDDSGRSDVALGALQLIGERPLFGFGSGNFSVMERQARHSHLQFLEVLGENGLVGLLLYAAAWIALVATTWRTEPRYRLGAVLLVGAWLIAHFSSHDVIVYRYFMLPIAYVCGLSSSAAVRRA